MEGDWRGLPGFFVRVSMKGLLNGFLQDFYKDHIEAFRSQRLEV